jgi:nucleotide-binding universal stress UspA family protein
MEDTMSFQRILVPVDFSDHSAQALEMARELAKAFGSKLILLHCYQVNPGAISPYGIVLPEGFDRDVREAAARRLGEWREKASEGGVDAEARLAATFPSMGICDAATEEKADLVVMGTRGLSGLKHVLLGSVAERTLRTAPCPVLTVKQGDA